MIPFPMWTWPSAASIGGALPCARRDASGVNWTVPRAPGEMFASQVRNMSLASWKSRHLRRIPSTFDDAFWFARSSLLVFSASSDEIFSEDEAIEPISPARGASPRKPHLD